MINFPNSPVLGQQFNAGLYTWTWNGVYWSIVGSSKSQVLTVKTITDLNYTLQPVDMSSTLLNMSSTNNQTVTVPLDTTNSIQTNTSVIIGRAGTGKVVIKPAAGVTVDSPSSLEINHTNGKATLLKTGTNHWRAEGNLASTNSAYFITVDDVFFLEGDSVTYTVLASDAPNGTELYWKTSGTSSAGDFVDLIDSGTVVIINNTATITRPILEDYQREGLETLVMSLYTDSNYNNCVATNSQVIIIEAIITPSAIRIREGERVTFTVTCGASVNTTLYWTLLPVTGTFTDADFLNPTNVITGGGSVNIINGRGILSLDVNVDQLFDTPQSFLIELRKDSTAGSIIATSDAVTVTGGSFYGVWDYALIEYYFSDGDDLDTRTRFITPESGTYNGWGWSQTADVTLGEWSGDNTGTGYESFLINIANIRAAYPTLLFLTVDTRCMWFNTIGTNPVEIRITLFRGGEMVPGNYTWTNPTATQSLSLSENSKVISYYSQERYDPGVRLGVLTYNLINGGGYFDENDQTNYPLPP